MACIGIMNKISRKISVIVFAVISCSFAVAQSQPIAFSPLWFDTCSPQDIVTLLKNHEFNVNMVFETEDEYYGQTPLMHAVKNKNPLVTGLLLKAGANVNAATESPRSNTAAVFAVTNQNAEVLKLLIAAGADMKHVRMSLADEGRGLTLLHFAEANLNPEIFKLLLKNGADPFMRSEMGGNTALMDCARVNTNPEVISVLLDAGLKINDQNDFGQTALTLAVEENKNPEVIKLLIDKGGDLSIIAGITEKKNVLELAESNPALKNTPVLLIIKRSFNTKK
jgi:ankyrin repeat protein